MDPLSLLPSLSNQIHKLKFQWKTLSQKIKQTAIEEDVQYQLWPPCACPHIHSHTYMYMHGICIKKEEEEERMGKEGERSQSNRDSASTS